MCSGRNSPTFNSMAIRARSRRWKRRRSMKYSRSLTSSRYWLGAYLNSLADVVAFNDDPGRGTLTQHLIGLLWFLAVLGGFDLDVLASRDDRLVSLRAIVFRNREGGVSRSRGPQFRRARELPRSCARE